MKLCIPLAWDFTALHLQKIKGRAPRETGKKKRTREKDFFCRREIKSNLFGGNTPGGFDCGLYCF